MANDFSRTCPACGAENDGNDLFCKECGGNLAAVNGATQQTAAFIPISPTSETQTTAIAPVIAPEITPTGSYEPKPLYFSVPATESLRGAVLGWLAATLILIIVAMFIWSSVFSDATRNSITGVF